MNTDARLSLGFPHHQKTKKLERRFGAPGPWAFVKLILWASQNHPDGDLTGVSDEDIEIAVDWNPALGSLVVTLAEVKFLDGAEGERRVHDWAQHNPWVVGAPMRSSKGRWNAIKGHYGEVEADRLVPEWAVIRRAASNAGSSAISRSASTAVEQCSVSASISDSNSETQKEAGAKAPPLPTAVGDSVCAPSKTVRKSSQITFATFLERCKAAGEAAIPTKDPVFTYVRELNIPIDYLTLNWLEFRHRYSGTCSSKRYVDWRAAFRNSIERNWFRLWTADDNDGWKLTSLGIQVQRAMNARDKARAAEEVSAHG